jgi:hypothetical protein
MIPKVEWMKRITLAAEQSQFEFGQFGVPRQHLRNGINQKLTLPIKSNGRESMSHFQAR